MTEITTLLIETQHPENRENTISSSYLTKHYSIVYLVFDILPLIILAAITIILSQVDLPVTERGFFCNDRTIRYPYYDSTVKSYELYSFLIPTILFFIILTLLEQFSYLYKRRCLQTLKPNTPTRVILNCIIRNFEIPFGLWKLAYVLYAFLVGFLVTKVVTDGLKLSVGELRPNFLDVCKPNLSPEICKNSGDYEVYVTNYTCTGDSDLTRQGRLSFPSGHSSVITYNMAFLIFYLETKQYLPRGIRSSLSLLFAITACLVSLSRLGDFKHHIHDIIAGVTIGSVSAVYTYFYLMRLNMVNSVKERKENEKQRADT